MFIYIIRNILNGKVYIGQTTGTLEKRWKRHLRASEQESNVPLYRAMKKHGADKFYIEKLDVASSIDELNLLEKDLINYHHSMAPNGYNAREGGCGGKLSQESLDKMAATKRGNKLSESHKKKLSEISLGKKKTTQHAKNISIAKSKSIVDESGVIYPSIKIAADILRLKASNITKVLHGHRKTTGGHTFKFANQ